MNFSGRSCIGADRQRVWDALNDPKVLEQCIPGCELVERVDDDHFNAVVTTKVGPVKAAFRVQLELQDLQPPGSYTIRGNGQGGMAGFANGSARVKLESVGTETELHYEVDAKIGGKLAQVGQRLIDGVVRKLSDRFFENLSDVLDDSAENDR